MTTITAGLTLLNRRGFSRPIVPVPVDLTPYNNKIAFAGRDLADAQANANVWPTNWQPKEQSENDACSGPEIEGPIMGTFNIGSYTPLQRDHEPGLCSQIHEGLSGQEVQDRC